MVKRFLIFLLLITALSAPADAAREDKEFLIQDKGNVIVLKIQANQESNSMKVKIKDKEYEGTKESADKVYFKFDIPKEVYSEFENADIFIDSLGIEEAGDELNILRNAKENNQEEKHTLKEIKNEVQTLDGAPVQEEAQSGAEGAASENQQASEEPSEGSRQNQAQESVKSQEELDKYYDSRDGGGGFKINPFLTAGLVLTVIGVVMNIRARMKG